MILVDANLLVYATNAAAREHDAARAWLDGRLSQGGRVGMPWGSLLAFLRLSTNSRIFDRPLAIPDAWAQVQRWVAHPPVWVPLPAERHAETLGRTLGEATRADDVPDAHLAALAIEHGLTLCSADRGFARYSGLRWENPLATDAG